MNIKKTILIILILIWMITVFVFSNQASTKSSNTSEKIIEVIMKVLNIDISDEKIQELQLPIRKLAHFTIYAIGGLLIALLINQYNILEIQKIIYSQLFITIYAITDELHQYFIPGRAACVTDVVIDSAGGLLVILIYTYISSQIKKEEGNYMSRILLASPHMSEEGFEKEYVKEAFDTNWIAPLGENVNKFEEELSKYVGTKNAAALSAGTAAIHMAFKALDIKQGDIVFCSTLTFSATANPIIYQNATPVFIDSEKETWNMDPKALEKAFEKYPNPKAVIVVHLYGTPAKIEEIKVICGKHNVPLVEDAAESLGATVNGKQTGTFGKYGVFSFNGNKIITTSGGGMLISEDEERIAKVRFWSTQSREPARHYEHKEIGYNYRMSNICAGIGRGQLKVLDDRIAKKTEIYNTYKEGFEDIEDVKMQPIPENSKPNHWLSVITLNKDSSVKPLDIMEELEKHNIETRPVWKPMHMQPVFNQYDFIKVEEKAVSEDLFERGICLPSDTKMTKEQQGEVIKLIRGCFNV